MTGFGRGESKGAKGSVTAEIRTFNHRFFDPAFRLPERFSIFEERIKTKVKRAVGRGKVNLVVTVKRESRCLPGVSVNQRLAKRYYNMAAGLRKELGLKDNITVEQILSLPEVLTYEEPAEDLNRLWPNIEYALDKALGRLVKAREAEGRVLYNELTKRINLISQALARIETRIPLVIEEYQRRIKRRIRDLIKARDLDKGKIELEVALFAKNCDVSEEVTRIKGHLKNFRSVLLGQGAIGQELDFIAQELNREANTIGSKANDFRIANQVIKIKSEIERIREQAHNVE